MQVLQVTDAGWNEPAFDSFQEAVDVSSRTERAKAAANDTSLLKEKEIVDAEYDDESVTIVLRGGEKLSFSLCEDTVVWTVQGCSNPNVTAVEVKPTQSAPLRLKFENIPDVYEWDRSDLISNILGKRILAIGAGVSVAFLCASGSIDWAFHRISIEGKNMLFFSPK